MARIQSKTSGRKPVRIHLCPKEIKAKAEQALVNSGHPSKQWSDYQTKKVER